jgi:hypothetical protein
MFESSWYFESRQRVNWNSSATDGSVEKVSVDEIVKTVMKK